MLEINVSHIQQANLVREGYSQRPVNVQRSRPDGPAMATHGKPHFRKLLCLLEKLVGTEGFEPSTPCTP